MSRTQGAWTGFVGIGLLTTVWVAGGLFAWPAEAQTSQSCQEPSPAFAAPRCVGASGNAVACGSGAAIQLWPESLRPADNGQLPSRRDSSQWKGTTRPETRSRDELFTGIDIVGDKAYVSYVSGFSIWDLACGTLGTESCPKRLSVREVFAGSFFHEDAGGEIYLLTWSIDAEEMAGKVYVALPGDSGEIGLSVWDATNPRNPRQIYQDWGRDGFEARLAVIGGRLYAFYASENASSAGIHVYDLSSLGAGSCFENTTESTGCGVYKGAVGAYSRSSYLDILQPNGPNGPTFLAHSRNSTSEGLEILEILDPSTSPPDVRQKTIEDYSGKRVRGVELFSHQGNSYLAANIGNDIRIFNAESCLSGSCSGLGDPIWSTQKVSSQRVFLTFSESVVDGARTPFLYVGGSNRCLSGARKEQLFQLSSLKPTAPNDEIFEITDSGGTYRDPENGLTVDYWSSYYARNTHGYSNVAPRQGRFYKEYFLRAATTLFDIHRYQGEATPQVILEHPSPGVFSTPVKVTATSASCPGTDWSWTHQGLPSCSAQVVSATASNSVYSITCPLPSSCSGSCPTAVVPVTAKKNCAGGGSAAASTMVRFLDNRLAIEEILFPLASPPREYPVCSVLDIGARVSPDAGPLDYRWSLSFADGSPVRDPRNGHPVVSASSTWRLDTTGLPRNPAPSPEEVFNDGFESGDLSRWQSGEAGGGVPASYFVDLRVRRPGEPASSAATAQASFTLTALAPLRKPSLNGTELGRDLWRFTETSPNATEWRWELWHEGVRKQVFDWSDPRSERTIEVRFPQSGNWQVRVSTSNCELPDPPPGQRAATFSVNIAGQTSDLEIAQFIGLSCGRESCFGSFCQCQPGDRATFKVFPARDSAVPEGFQIDWTCEDAFSADQTFRAPRPEPDGSYLLTHTYRGPCASSPTGRHKPQVRMVKGNSLSNVEDCRETLLFP